MGSCSGVWHAITFLVSIIILVSSELCLASQTRAGALQIRGGVQQEQNPNNHLSPLLPPNNQGFIRPITLGDLDKTLGQQSVMWENAARSAVPSRGRHASVLQTMRDYTKQLHATSPTLSTVSLASIFIFILWQIDFFKTPLSRHFLCSRSNWKTHPQSLVLNAVSHASFMHLLVNLFAYTSFGPPLRQVLKTSHWPLWPLVVGAALSGSLVFLLLGRGSCLGLSSVTLAFLAMEAKLYPDRQIGTVLGIFLVQVPAHLGLKLLLLVSALGTLDRNSSIAHSAHLGGILFGLAYYEAWLRRRKVRQFYQLFLKTLQTRWK